MLSILFYFCLWAIRAQNINYQTTYKDVRTSFDSYLDKNLFQLPEKYFIPDPKANYVSSRTTIVVLTSPHNALPSTCMLQSVMLSFHLDPSLRLARRIIVFDSIPPEIFQQCKTIPKNTVNRTRKRDVYRQKNCDKIGLYETYKNNVRKLITDDPVFRFTEIIELKEHGFWSGAVYSAMLVTKTPYILLAGHDTGFAKKVDVNGLLNDMDAKSEIKHIMFSRQSLVNGGWFWHIDNEVPVGTLSPLLRTFSWSDAFFLSRRDYIMNVVIPAIHQRKSQKSDTKYPVKGYAETTMDTWMARVMKPIMLPGGKADIANARHSVFGTYLYGKKDDPIPYAFHMDTKNSKCGEGAIQNKI